MGFCYISLMAINTAATYKLNNIEEDFPKFSELFRTFCKAHNIPSDTVFEMELSVEELAINSFAYGSDQGILISIGVDKGELKVTVEDKAPPFNLLRDAPDPPEGSLEDRKVGGLGIHLVKNLNDRIEYSGSNIGNKITLFKLLSKD